MQHVVGRGLGVVDGDRPSSGRRRRRRCRRSSYSGSSAAARARSRRRARSYGNSRLRVVVAPAHPRVRRRRVEVPPVLLGVLAVVALGAGQAEDPLLEDRVAAVPEREREAERLPVVADAGEAVLAPAVGARAGVVVREVAPTRRRRRCSPRARCPRRARSGTGPQRRHGARPVRHLEKARPLRAGYLLSHVTVFLQAAVAV